MAELEDREYWLARAEKALERLAQETKPVCRIVYENGKPYFDIGGRRFETTFYNCSEQWSDDNPKLRRQTALFRDAENIADRVPGKMPAVGNVVPGKLCFP